MQTHSDVYELIVPAAAGYGDPIDRYGLVLDEQYAVGASAMQARRETARSERRVTPALAWTS